MSVGHTPCPSSCLAVHNRWRSLRVLLRTDKGRLLSKTPSLKEFLCQHFRNHQSATSAGFFNTSMDGESTTSLVSLFQCFATLSVKNFFLISGQNLPWCNLKPFPLILSLVTLEKGPAPTLLQPPFRYLWETIRFFQITECDLTYSVPVTSYWFLQSNYTVIQELLPSLIGMSLTLVKKLLQHQDRKQLMEKARKNGQQTLITVHHDTEEIHQVPEQVRMDATHNW